MYNRDFKRKERDKGIENIFEETKAENSPDLKIEIYIQICTTQSLKQNEPKHTYTKTDYK